MSGTQIRFEVRVTGTLPAELSEELADLEVSSAVPSTVLTGVVPDQAALLGLVARLRALGLEVTELRRVPPARRPMDDET